MKKKIFYLFLCLIALSCINGCDYTTKDNRKDDNYEEKINKEDNSEDKKVKEEKPNTEDKKVKEESPNTEDKKDNSIYAKYVISGNEVSYLILNKDNTFRANVNYCSGYYETTGTYEVKYKNHLTGKEPDSVILHYKDKTKDTLKVTKYSNGMITNLRTDLDNSDMILSACSGYDLYIVK